MARTRSRTSRDIQIRSGNDENDDPDQDAQPSAESISRFKTRLQTFQSNSTSAATSTAKPPKPSTTVSSLKRPHSPPPLPLSTIPAKKPRPPKKQKKSSTYAPPSTYAHLSPLTDILQPGLICVFVGTNPGIRTATAGHAYAHPSNLFWRLLHSSGCTDTRLDPSQDVDLPRLYSMGNTNIVSRPSRDMGELSKEEMAAGTPVLEAKVREHRPEAVCIVGKGIWEAVWRWRYGRNMRKGEFGYGWQEEQENLGKEEGWGGARVFVATSTSGLSASTRPAEKEAIWRPFGEWVRKRRREREEEDGRELGMKVEEAGVKEEEDGRNLGIEVGETRVKQEEDES